MKEKKYKMFNMPYECWIYLKKQSVKCEVSMKELIEHLIKKVIEVNGDKSLIDYVNKLKKEDEDEL